ncbi:MAG: NUDIX hydrolase [Trueperaceae bacterium]|nr:MAG: NUDIX hydrolase [Trueperaceae bacterium]
MRDVKYSGRILRLVVLDDRWEIVEHQSAVAVVALSGRSILGVEQYRPAIGDQTWELPAGLIDPGEDPSEAAARELAEETQLKGELSLITQLYPSPGFCDEKVYLFRAQGLSPVEGRPEEEEDLSVSWRDAESVWRDVRSGNLSTSGPSLLGVAFALNLLGMPL